MGFSHPQGCRVRTLGEPRVLSGETFRQDVANRQAGPQVLGDRPSLFGRPDRPVRLAVRSPSCRPDSRRWNPQATPHASLFRSPSASSKEHHRDSLSPSDQAGFLLRTEWERAPSSGQHGAFRLIEDCLPNRGRIDWGDLDGLTALTANHPRGFPQSSFSTEREQMFHVKHRACLFATRRPCHPVPSSFLPLPPTQCPSARRHGLTGLFSQPDCRALCFPVSGLSTRRRCITSYHCLNPIITIDK